MGRFTVTARQSHRLKSGGKAIQNKVLKKPKTSELVTEIKESNSGL